MLATRCDNIHLRNYKKLGSRKNEVPSLEADWDKQFSKHIRNKIEALTESTSKTVKIV
jgi:hypothetical protein